MASTVFMEKKARIEVLEALDKKLDDMLESKLCDYQCVSETVTDEQDRHWRTNELLWEDEEKTIPKMRVDREYAYVPRPADELTDEDRAFKAAVEEIRKFLVKMI